MTSTINPAGSAFGAESGGGGARQHPSVEEWRRKDRPTASSAAGDQKPPIDVRLLIEQDHRTGGLVYRLVDAATGAVIKEIPREEVQAMGDLPSYVAGAVVKATA